MNKRCIAMQTKIMITSSTIVTRVHNMDSDIFPNSLQTNYILIHTHMA